MNILRIFVFIGCAVCGANVMGQSVEQLKWMTEQFPPYNFQDQQRQPKGIVLDVVGEMLSAQRVPWQVDQFAFLPWARSYAQLQRLPGTVLFSMVQTPAREALFRFVGPVIATRVVLLAPKRHGFEVNTVADMDRLRIGVVREDIGHQLLKEAGVTEQAIQPSSQLEHLIQQMRLDRIDAIAYEERVASWEIRHLGFNPADYEVLSLLHEGKLSIAFHRDTPSELLDQFQATLDELKAKGRVAEIVERYK